MNIKSLILGSATAALAATGAQAADAIIIAEPEPVEYVRVCDVYGAGFFYIPGTETCLLIGGEIRQQFGAADGTAFNRANGNTQSYHGYAEDTWDSRARLRVVLDARSETELGQLRGYARMQWDRGNNDAINSSVANHAWLSLGGFRAGFTDSAFVHTLAGGFTGSHSDGGLAYGYQQSNLIQYNFTGGSGFYGTVSLESRTNRANTIVTTEWDANYVPDIVGVVGVAQGWGSAWLRVGYDSNRQALGAFGPEDKAGYGVNLGMQYNIPGAPGSSLRLGAWYADSDNRYNPLTGTGYAYQGPTGFPVSTNGVLGGSEWSIMGSYYHQFNAQFGASIAAQYFGDLYFAGTDVSSGIDGWALELNAVWTPVQNFAVRGELVYSDFDYPAGLDGDSVSGFIRFSRFF